jgi:hypothetical protein
MQVSNADTGAVFASGARQLPGGPVQAFTFGNGLLLEQAFNLRYQPWSVTSGPVQLGYTMTPAGDVGAITEPGTPRTYQYDFLDRLASSPGWLQYGYDGTGNRTSETVEGAAATYTYNTWPANSSLVMKKLVPGASGNVNALAFGYDNQTNVTAIGLYNAAGTAFAKTVCLRHDPLGRVVTVGQKSSASFTAGTTACLTDAEVSTVLARFRYDSRNRRVARWLPSTGWTYFTHGPDARRRARTSAAAPASVLAREAVRTNSSSGTLRRNGSSARRNARCADS